MTDAQGTVQGLLLQVTRALEPLERELGPGRAVATFAELGIPLTASQEGAIAGPLAAVRSATHDMMQMARELVVAMDADDGAATLAKTAGLIEDLVATIVRVDDLVAAVQAAGVSVPAATVAALPERLLNLLLVRALAPLQGVNELLELLGILERVAHNAGSTDPAQPPFTVSTFAFGALGEWIESPADKVGELYEWGEDGFTGATLLTRLAEALSAVGAPAYFDPATVTLDLVLLQISPRTDLSPKGLQIATRSSFGPETVSFARADWKIELAMGVTLPFGLTCLVQPTGITLVPPTAGDVFEGDARFSFVADRTNAAEGFILLGDAGEGSRLEIRKFVGEIGARFTGTGGTSSAAIDVGGEVSGGKVVISFGDADSFVGSLVSAARLESDFEFALGYSADEGFYFVGSSSLEIQLPLHVSLGPVEVTALTISVGIEAETFPAFIAADLKASLGPLQVVVQEIGVEIDLALKADHSGNAGPLDIGFGFKPPTGVGLSIDTGLVRGGGFLRFDPDAGEYAGIAELSIAGIVTVKAVGLISTDVPGGPAFSLLVIISGEFTPIQLGLGFTLVGVGGLVGLNRGVLLDVLRDGIRTGSVDSIMFPTDVIGNAPRIISDLRAIFPPEDGTFLVGPMAKFGWGTPTLVTLSLGVIVEIPPGNIAIVGVLKVVLPDEDAALIQLQVNFVGILDLERQLISFDASLFDSRVLFMGLEGDMAVRVKWGDDPAFLLSVGGFHPSFTPPPLDLPTLRRISVRILDFDWARIRIDSYFAVTSNTVQFGARAELFFGVDGCNVSGHIGYDVLFQFSPFYFNALVSGSLNLEVIGVDVLSINLRLSLEGPSPWRARGTGSVSILFWDIDVDFDVTWGEQTDTTLPPVRVMPVVAREMGKQENWRAIPPPASNLLVSVRQLEPELLVLHPFGALTVSQRAVPLDLTLDKLGNQRPEDVNRVDVTRAGSGGNSFALTPVDESFALAQFQDMSDAEKLSRPSYQKTKGGVVIGGTTASRSSTMTRRKIAYEVTIIDKEPVKPRGRLVEIESLFAGFLSGAAVARSDLAFHARDLLAPQPGKVVAGDEEYIVASTVDNTAFDGPTTFSSEAMAAEYMNRSVAADPALAGALHVMPAFEVNA